jgi:ribosomal protein S18 acetylase RimI-like enzyme
MNTPQRVLVRRLGRSDLRSAGPVLADSFWDYPEVVHVIPNEDRRQRVLPRYLTADCVDAVRFNTLYGAYHDGNLVGVSAWLPAGAYPLSRAREIATLAYMAPIVPWVLRKVPGVLRAQEAKDAGHPHEPHIYLCEIGVNQRAQGTGAGSALMHSMTESADEAAVGCYLSTSSEANTAWYRRFGFEVTADFCPTPDWPRVWRMWRRPLGTSAPLRNDQE